jgi:bifunctional UDP-N-acetylglucosamine pyrophosphorylase/glucosamine-1-phosphate N-acetyltransferase
MNSFFFKEKTEFRSSKNFRDVTGLSDIHFDKNTTLILKGKIFLSAGIRFSGICNLDDGVSIDMCCFLKDVTIGKNTYVRSHSVLQDSVFGQSNIVGPYCFVRDETMVGNNCIVGSHVEVARSQLGSETKISHQAFIGDAIIDKSVIIGAGVVFCNYDGSCKQSSKIGEGTIIGSGSMIVSPIKVGSQAIIGAGSIITKDIDDNIKFMQKK